MNLYKHQQEIVDDNPLTTGLWLGCGSGKTRTALVLAEGRTLVICLKTQRDDKTWEKELDKMGIEIDLTVMSKEDFRKNADDLERYDTVIVDEATSCLGVSPSTVYRGGFEFPKTSQLFGKLVQYIKNKRPKRIYLLTATIIKTPLTVWGAGVILGHWDMETYFKFKRTFYTILPMNKKVDIYAPKKDVKSKEHLAKLVRNLGYIGRLEDFVDVPEQTFHTEKIELTAPQKSEMKDVKLNFPDPQRLDQKRHQIENGILIGDEYGYSPTREIKDNKIPKLIDYAIEFPKMIIFIKFTKQIEKTYEALKKEGHNVFVLNGKTKNAGEMFDEIAKVDNYILIVQFKISKGWELPECPVMIFASQDYHWEDYNQSLGRIQRANNVKKNLYITLESNYDFIVTNGKGKKINKRSVDHAVSKSLANGDDFNEKIYAETGE